MPKKVTRAEILNILVDPQYITREDQAIALRISRKVLWERLKADLTIEADVTQAVREATAQTVKNGMTRMHRIISSTHSQDKDAIKALEVVLKYRGELVDKREHSGPGGDSIKVDIGGDLSDEEVQRIAGAVSAGCGAIK